MAKQKVAILGGGVSALAAAYAMTSTQELRDTYDVTLYQLGWRLGGKGASGRNPDDHQRIEEHGLHIWFGFYENAFREMKKAYEDLGREEGPIRTWKDAFHPHSYVVLEEKMQQGLMPWQFVFPTNTDEPGTGGLLPSPLAYAELAIEWLIRFVEGRLLGEPDATPPTSLPPAYHGILERAATRGPRPRAARAAAPISILGEGPLPRPTHPITELLHKAHTTLSALPEEASLHAAVDHSFVTWAIRAAMDLAWLVLKGRVDTDLDARKTWVAINLAGSAVVGLIEDDVLHHGWGALDRWDLREWLARHGANETTTESGPLRGIYDLVFGFVGGDVRRGNFAAGVAMRGILRMLFTYKGAFMYRMEAGMGDIVATPFYEVLKRRGVRFEFFHRVEEIDADGDRVHRIRVQKQVKLKAGAYDPLVDVGSVPSWPSFPRYEQIVDGEALRASGIDLESSWAPRWKDAEEIVLEHGKDFDTVVLAISIAALKDVAKPLLEKSPRLATSVEAVKTAQTQALQLWVARDTASLGWKAPAGVTEGTVLGAFHEPIDTWADMSDLLPREAWGPSGPKGIHYFCGPWRDAKEIPPYSDHEFPARERRRYVEEAVTPFLATKLKDVWPDFTEADVVSRYVRVNIDPTERYVLSVQGTTHLRLDAKESGFSNLVLCGDWTANGFDAGCVEAAVMSGLRASNAVCGVPALDEIVGA